MPVAGVDIGSLTAKAVVLEGTEMLGNSLVLTGHNSRLAGREALEKALEDAGLEEASLDLMIATGYGRHAADFAGEKVTEITCHAREVGSARVAVVLGHFLACEVCGMSPVARRDHEVEGGLLEPGVFKRLLEGFAPGEPAVVSREDERVAEHLGTFQDNRLGGQRTYINTCNGHVHLSCIDLQNRGLTPLLPFDYNGIKNRGGLRATPGLFPWSNQTDTTSLISGISSLSLASMPLLRVRVAIGQPPQAPTRRTLTTPSSTSTSSTSPPSL